MFDLLAAAFVLGLVFNASPGAVFAESLRRGLRGGFPPAFAVQVGSLVGDFVWACLGLLGASAAVALPGVATPLGLPGAGLLGWLAVLAARDALSPMPAFEPLPGSLPRGARAAGVALSLTNPSNIACWAALGGVVGALGVAEPGRAAFAVFLAGFMLSSVLWCFACAGGIAWTRRRLGPLGWRGLNLASAAGLAAFAVIAARGALS